MFAIETEASADSSVAAATPAISKVTVDELTVLRKQAETAEQLDEATRTTVLESFDKATAKLQEAKRLSDLTELLRKELSESGKTLEQLQAEMAQAESATVAEVPVDGDVHSQLTTSDSELAQARDELKRIVTEIDQRAVRRQKVPEATIAARQQLAEVEQSLKSVGSTDDSPEVAQARQMLLLARRELRQRELESLEQETKTYEGTARVWLLRRDLAEKRLKPLERKREKLQALVTERERREAELQAREARRAAVNAHPAVKEAAAVNSQLAEQNKHFVEQIESTRKQTDATLALTKTLADKYDEITKRASAAKNSPVIGVMLRSQRDQLPSLGQYRDSLRRREKDLSKLGLAIYEWEAQRREAIDIDETISNAKTLFEATASQIDESDAEAALRNVLTVRSQILTDLTRNADTCVNKMQEQDAAERNLVRTVQQLNDFIAEQVLWVRSAPPLSLRDLSAFGEWKDYLSGSRDAGVATTRLWRNDLRRAPIFYVTVVLFSAWLIISRRRFRHKLEALGVEATKTTVTTFRPTALAALYTLALSLPLGYLLGTMGWRLTTLGTSESLEFALGWTLLLTAAGYGMLSLTKNASRPGGLGAAHFGWDEKTLCAIRRAVRFVAFFVLPPLSIAVACEIRNQDALANSVGRISLIAALAILGVVCFQLLRSSGALATTLATSSKNSLVIQSIRFAAPLSAMAVLALIVASAGGYHYTAIQLTRRILVSCLFVFGCLALRSFLMRWLFVAYRKVAIQDSRERMQASANTPETASLNSTRSSTPCRRLSDINRQARSLVSMGATAAFVVSLCAIWSEILPALGVLDNVTLWQKSLAADGTPLFVTLGDLFAAGITLALTWYAGKNLPGLLQIVVFQRLPMDAGARYAASSVTRYLIVVVGAVLSLRQIGIGWSSVQWLVAAMTVGLGFGLQEIFANFVSGIILLFERPARVGDTVTIGSITGTVTRIQIRATTILDWDNKELIVPNKDFVTGNLINWTLSNPVLRLIVKVGVAYGSDTRLTTELLYKVAKENPDVLNDPEPVVVFVEFGSSSLDFELRVFVSDLALFRRLKHNLNLAIDDQFRQHNIEIAFPQCDLHVRTLPQHLPEEIRTLLPSDSTRTSKAA